jgi:hypothetical protein
MPSGADRILTERRRQIELEDWSDEHDDEHDKGEMGLAAASYIMQAVYNRRPEESPSFWPWDLSWWKPAGQIRNLEKAGALIAAEIDRLVRKRESDVAKKLDEMGVQ